MVDHELDKLIVKRPRKETPAYIDIKLDKDINLAPNTETFISVKADGLDVNALTIFTSEKTEKNFKKGIVWSNSIDAVRNDKTIRVSVINASSVPVKLRKSQVVGQISEVDANDID